ncbi:hypothetical protein CYMTET_7312 [Cymbomonas tetramitiformis]|uniref:PCIF1 WW domain-containing protein n=1 Tax=Cymbomonas tetramitiformis TaxID=36881 RepID=A0AAE0GVC9_9CHLO|nr:hypothetical protein CYMTET_7312 [Cymbomonas tetramitiformis]
MSHLIKSTGALLEYHTRMRGYGKDKTKQQGGRQTRYNTLRKLNALQDYGVNLQGAAGHLRELRTRQRRVMTQFDQATRSRTEAELQGRHRATKTSKAKEGWGHGEKTKWKLGGGWYHTPDVQVPINFTVFLTLFRNYPDLMHLTIADGNHAIPIEALKSQRDLGLQASQWVRIREGMKQLYPYICVNQPTDVNKPGKFWETRDNRRLKEEYMQTNQSGPIQRERQEDGDQERRGNGKRGRGEAQDEDERSDKWATNAEPMDRTEVEIAVMGDPPRPTKIGAVRVCLNNPEDMDSGMTQYKTHWRQGVETIVTWSLKDTINRYGAGGDTEDLAEVLLRDMEAREAAKSDEKVGHAEIVMERPTGEHRNWPGVQRLDIQHGEINPDEDIYPGTAEQAQLRTEGETSYSYNDKGRLVGKIATRKLSRLYKRYASKVGDRATGVTQRQEKERLRIQLKHGFTVDTFENEAFGLETEVFASPLNVHESTERYYSQYARDEVFGAESSAWEMELGAYQFNPKYEHAVHKALAHAVAATDQTVPTFGVGIYPTYAKSPYRRQINKHKGNRIHQILEVPEGQFRFLPPDHWTGEQKTRLDRCNWALRILVVANTEGWEKYCPDATKAYGVISEALKSCPQSRVSGTKEVAVGRPLNKRDEEWHAEVGRHDSGQPCQINLRPWQQHETPTNPKGLRGKEVGERRRSMEDMVEAWWTYQNYPGEVQKPTVQEAMDDNEEGSRGDIRRKAVQRWKATFQETVIYPDTFRSLKGEHEPGRKGATWGKRWEKEKGAVSEEAKTYNRPERMYDPRKYIYTDGSLREVALENGEKDERTGAGVWDPRGDSPGEAHEKIRRHKYNTGTILQELGRTLTTEPETWKRKEVPQPTGGTAKSSANGEQEVSVEEATEEDREAIERAVEEEIQEDNRRLVRDAERREADDKMRKEMEFHEWIDERTEEEQWEVGANEEEQREEEFHRWIDEEMSRVGRMNEDCPKVEMTEEWVGDEQEVGEEEVAQEWPRDRARETISYKAGETDEQEVERIKRDMEGVTLEE